MQAVNHMDVSTISFASEDERRNHPGLFARWRYTQCLLERPQQLHEAPIVCRLCGDVTRLSPVDPSAPIDVREGLACAGCGMSARSRAALAMLSAVARPSDRIYITEQSTPMFAALQARFPQVRGSEFEADEDKRRAMATYLASLGGSGDVNFEDVTRLGMDDASLDVVLSFDVLEHVPDYRAALREFARVLRPGGVLQATFPFTDCGPTVVRASLQADGGVQHHLEPEYHGDPIGGPVLCFYHFGWDVLGEARSAGFARAEMVAPWSPEQGIYYGHWVLQAWR